MNFLVEGPEDAKHTLVLAHGAGAPMDSGFMSEIPTGLGAKAVRVVRFEFPYMQARRETGARKGPDREPVLLESWRQVAKELGGGTGLAIGGKSMGGRMASMVADELGVAALVCLGYPFHPPGRPDRLRTAHLSELRTPALIVQGSRDPFGGRDEVLGYPLAPAVRLHWLEDGDHDFRPRAASGRTHRQNKEEAVEVVARFLASLQSA